jgi:hypothetical protein
MGQARPRLGSPEAGKQVSATFDLVPYFLLSENSLAVTGQTDKY